MSVSRMWGSANHMPGNFVFKPRRYRHVPVRAVSCGYHMHPLFRYGAAASSGTAAAAARIRSLRAEQSRCFQASPCDIVPGIHGGCHTAACANGTVARPPAQTRDQEHTPLKKYVCQHPLRAIHPVAEAAELRTHHRVAWPAHTRRQKNVLPAGMALHSTDRMVPRFARPPLTTLSCKEGLARAYLRKNPEAARRIRITC